MKKLVMLFIAFVVFNNMCYAEGSPTGTLQIRLVVLPRMDIKNCESKACTINKDNINLNIKEENTQYYTKILKDDKLIYWF